MKLQPSQIKKYSRYLEIIGIAVITIYVSVGIYAYFVTDNSCSYSVFCIALHEVFANKSTEGNNYIVSISDGVGTQDILG